MKPQLVNWMGIAVFSLVGCTTPSPFPDMVMKEVNAKVELGVLTATPDVYKGRVVELAGRIVGVEQRTEGTVIVVHQLPFSTRPPYWPVERNGHNGDFTVFMAGKLEPIDAMVGNRLTVIGTVAGPTQAGAGTSRPLPHLLARCVAIWETLGEGIPDYIAVHGDYYGTPPIEHTYCTKGTSLNAS